MSFVDCSVQTLRLASSPGTGLPTRSVKDSHMFADDEPGSNLLKSFNFLRYLFSCFLKAQGALRKPTVAFPVPAGTNRAECCKLEVLVGAGKSDGVFQFKKMQV